MSTAERARELSFVEADLNYSIRTGAKPVSETYGRDGLERRYTGKFERHRVRIADGRPPSAVVLSASKDGLSTYTRSSAGARFTNAR